LDANYAAAILFNIPLHFIPELFDKALGHGFFSFDFMVEAIVWVPILKNGACKLFYGVKIRFRSAKDGAGGLPGRSTM
jgi:hypothetical protein